MKLDFRKVLKAFEEEPETDPERMDDKHGQGEPAYFYPNKDWEQRFCKHCEFARAVVILGIDDRDYVCNRLASGTKWCPHEKDHREGYRQSVPLTPGPPPGISNEDVVDYLDRVNDSLDDVIDSMESIAEAKKKGGAAPNGRYSTWIHAVDEIPVTCSACGEDSPPDDYEYCPHCGARMEMVVK